ncbi:MAG: twin-arginine translocase TatA/TatE family subunit, partial [Nitrososphaeria archaeon]|nr:twin-arginine translocase TatA/TatE family subunit [Nitrososphaeria archaeon]
MLENQALFNIAGMEWFWVLIVVVVLLFGASKIPELAKAIG